MLRETTFIVAIIALLFIHSQPALADIYQFTDKNGVIHLSNVGVDTTKKYKRIKSVPETPATEQQAVSNPRPAAPSRSSLSSSNISSVYGDIISTACDRHGIDPALVNALVKVESDFNPYAVSKKGAMGLMQLMPQTAINMNVRNTFDPNDNIDGGVKYLRYLLDRYEGNLSLALAAYNSGETAVNKWGAIPPFRETQNYVQRIMSIYTGKRKKFNPRYTIYVGYGEDGALLLTDDPSRHQNTKLKRRTLQNL
jgi:soluble lytic murein transglycosylase-like protein